MAKMGADPEQLRALGKKMDQEAEQITQAERQISSQLKSAWWEGKDGDKFRSEWDGQFSAQLRKISEALKQAGQVVRKQAEQQTQTSSA
jgi:uncharacterized protein YukE